ncbi:glycoside hydrolase family 36 protein [Clostridium lacusfryxellense]|uniref:glycoside hydrolase family 36 protein n=1 Tax=Clostridium lacusfryxellense TaxID=205328 RepID=UPI001C0AAEDB|nr:glycoside hydrolase family 36 protein [Clostridium lacusfryxellense]MBU3113315.1 alpha-galactosidase [Clostridium lacusfryxellense]
MNSINNFDIHNIANNENHFASWTKFELTLNNGVVKRIIKLPSPTGNFLTTFYQPVVGEFKYFEPQNTDFQFEVNGLTYSGQSDWSLIEIKAITDTLDGDGSSVTLLSLDKKIEVILKFLLYPNLPVIRKNLVIKNLANEEIYLESIDVEKFNISHYFATTFSWIYSDYGRRKSIGPYDGNMQDALVIVHNMDWESGIVIGNEASGVMKHTSVFWDAPEIITGLTHKNATFPFRTWIKTNESFETPQVFTMVYNNHKKVEEVLNTSVPDFVRKHMGIRLSRLQEKPTFVYNTWVPFGKDINEKLIMDLAKAASDAGMKEFVIDDGWQDSYGDWGIDKTKFPNGLKPVFDYIKSLGMKPGLWVSIGTAAPDSKVYNQHPEWFVEDINGKPISLIIDESDKYTACFCTGWYGHIKAVLKRLIVEYGLEYLKLDFSVVSSPYRFDNTESGCYSNSHEGHKDHSESLFSNYEPMWTLFDELHVLNSELFIDCTFETMGGLQLIDYAMLKHAEGNWLSNFDGTISEKTDLRVRNMAWWRSPAMPATALVIGNPQMQDKGWEMHIKSLAGALPIMLGDPRKLTPEDLKIYRNYADWLQLMEKKYDIMSYRQDLSGFSEPMEGSWDGFQRINTDSKNGGIIGIFRHGANEMERTVFINYLSGLEIYEVKAINGNLIASLTGYELKTKGFELTLKDFYSGELFEIAEKTT